MTELLNQYVDTTFVDALTELAPAIGFGLILGIIIAVFGWLWGFVIRLGKLDICCLLFKEP